jgi:hypothetical protein
MQVFHDNAILSGTLLKGQLTEGEEELRLLLNPLTLDDMTKIWSAFQDVGYRLSVSYLITPVQIDSARSMDTRRVSSKETDHASMTPKKEES